MVGWVVRFVGHDIVPNNYFKYIFIASKYSISVLLRNRKYPTSKVEQKNAVVIIVWLYRV